MKKITILLSLLLAAAASAGDFGWLGGGGGVARIDTGSISTAHVMADTVSPFNESTVYIRNATFDTVTIRRIVHNQEIALFDSLGWWADGTDTVKIDPTLGKRIEVEDDNVTVFSVDEGGDLIAQAIVAQDSSRNEGPLRQKGIATFGATATPAVIGADGSVTAQNITAAGFISGKMPPKLDGAGATITLTADSCAGWVRVHDVAAAKDYTLPGASAGLCVMFLAANTGIITIDPVDGTDTIYLDGVSVGAGDAIDSPGFAGNFIVLYGLDDTRWITLGRSGVWVDGGAD